jgi:hypothetical protein
MTIHLEHAVKHELPPCPVCSSKSVDFELEEDTIQFICLKCLHKEEIIETDKGNNIYE